MFSQLDDINLSQVSQDQCTLFEGECKKEQLKDNKPLKQQSVRRNLEKNKRTFVNNYIIDILMEFGYFFNVKKSKRYIGSYQMDRINNIFYNNKLLCSREEMYATGMRIQQYLFSLMKNSRGEILVMDKGNEEIMKMMNVFC